MLIIPLVTTLFRDMTPEVIRTQILDVDVIKLLMMELFNSGVGLSVGGSVTANTTSAPTSNTNPGIATPFVPVQYPAYSESVTNSPNAPLFDSYGKSYIPGNGSTSNPQSNSQNEEMMMSPNITGAAFSSYATNVRGRENSTSGGIAFMTSVDGNNSDRAPLDTLSRNENFIPQATFGGSVGATTAGVGSIACTISLSGTISASNVNAFEPMRIELLKVCKNLASCIILLYMVHAT